MEREGVEIYMHSVMMAIMEEKRSAPMCTRECEAGKNMMRRLDGRAERVLGSRKCVDGVLLRKLACDLFTLYYLSDRYRTADTRIRIFNICKLLSDVSVSYSYDVMY